MTSLDHAELASGEQSLAASHSASLDETLLLASNGGSYPGEDRSAAYTPSESNLGYDDNAVPRAAQYVSSLFPGEKLSLLSSEGSSAVVFHDQAGRVYKVYRRSSYYDYIEEEAAKLEMLSQLGLAPKLYALVDASQAYRAQAGPDASRAFGAVRIPRIESDGPFAVLVMGEIPHPLPLKAGGVDTIVGEFGRICNAVRPYGFIFGDVEPVWEQSARRIVFLDVGGVQKYDHKGIVERTANIAAYAGLSVEQASELMSVASLASCITNGFGDGLCGVEEIRPIWERQGAAGVQSYLISRLRRQDRMAS